jgi:formylglycine-generating enzyme required for sulfatase activity
MGAGVLRAGRRRCDRWNLVAQLGVEEFLYNTRNGERQLLYLVYHLLGDDLSSLQVQHAALWSGQMAALVGRRLIEGDRSMPNGGTTYLDRLLPRLVQLLSRDLNASERCQVGDVLGQLGDPRFRPDAWYLPDEPLLGFVGIPAGPFLMGSKKGNHLAYDNEMPQRKITLPLYYIARYPVIIAQFKAFVDDSGDTLGDEDSLRRLRAPLRRHGGVQLSCQECWNFLYAPILSPPQGSQIPKGRGECSMVGERRGATKPPSQTAPA